MFRSGFEQKITKECFRTTIRALFLQPSRLLTNSEYRRGGEPTDHGGMTSRGGGLVPPSQYRVSSEPLCPRLISLCSPDPQAYRPPEEPPNVLTGLGISGGARRNVMIQV